MKYSASDIKVNNTPKITELSNNKREQIWNIVLKNKVDTDINLIEIANKLSHKDFKVKILSSRETCLKVSVITSRLTNPYGHDYSIFSIDKMFDQIEELFRNIDTIEGQKIEDRWRPVK